MSDRAVIEAELLGVSKVESGARKISKALDKAKESAGKNIQAEIDARTSQVQLLGSKIDALRSGLAPSAIFGSTVTGAVSGGLSALASALSRATTAAQQFAAATGKTSRLTEVPLKALQAAENRVQQQTAIAPEESGGFVEGVQARGGDPRKAIDALERVAKLAKAEGRSMGEYAESFVNLTRGMGLSGEAAAEKLGALSEQARRLKVIGGPQALIDSLSQLGPVLEDVSKRSPKATQDVEALFRTLVGKGMAPAKALAAVQSAVGFIKGNAEGQYSVKSLLGHETLDQSTGQALQPVADLMDVERRLRRRYRSETQRESARRATYGAGSDLPVVMRTLTDAELRQEAATQDRDTSTERFKRYAETPGGAAEIAEGGHEVEVRQLGKPLARQKSKLQRVGAAAESAGLRILGGRDAFNSLGQLADDVAAVLDNRAPPAAAAAAPAPATIVITPEAARQIGDATADGLRRTPIKATVEKTGPGRNDQGGGD